MNRGELITASALNTINDSIKQSWSWGHAGWSWASRHAYWYCTRTSGTMMVQANSTSSGNQKKLTLQRWENGSWVQKNYSDTASGTKTIIWNTYGRGAYHLYIYDHNNTPYLTVYTSDTGCEKGKLLSCISDYPTGKKVGGYHDEASVKAINGRAKGTLLTADLINHGCVYTLRAGE